MLQPIKFQAALIFLWVALFATDGWAQRNRKEKENPPRLEGIQYRWCQPITEKQLKQRTKWGMPFDRKVGREEGKRRPGNGSRIGKWTFWDTAGKKMAEGECQSPPPKQEALEHGKWSYWDLSGHKVEMDWHYGDYNGQWTLYDSQGIKRWQYEIHRKQPKQELFADESYLKSEGLWQKRRNPKKNVPGDEN